MKRELFRLAFAGLMVCTVANGAGETVRFEAEDITGPRDAWLVDKHSEAKWNLWSTDKDAMKKWSEGVVLQSPRVLKDRMRH